MEGASAAPYEEALLGPGSPAGQKSLSAGRGLSTKVELEAGKSATRPPRLAYALDILEETRSHETRKTT